MSLSDTFHSVKHKRAVADLRSLVDVVQTRQLTFLAAAIAYYAFLSVVPLLIVSVTVVSSLAGEAIAAEVLEALDGFLTPTAANLVEETLVDGEGRGGVTVIGLAVLLWGGLRVFRGLDIAFGRIYGVEITKSLPYQVRDALLVLVGIFLAIGGTVGLSAILSLIELPVAGLTGTVGLMVVLTAVFFPMYYVFPGQAVPVRDALPGAVVASLGWTALGAGFGIYAANTGSSQLYGVLGGVLLLLVWFYFGGLIILLGAAVNVVRSDRQLQQGPLRENIQRSMTEADGPTDEDTPRDETETEETERTATEQAEPDSTDDGPTGRRDPDVSARVTQEDIDDLRRELDEMEHRLETRTVHRDELEADLKQYVRKRSRRGHATGWGPYLVLLYGTVMTLGAFFFLSSGFAVLAMLIIWLSTLGLYALMLVVSLTVTGVSLPGRLLDTVRNLR
jgi:YihY family inner membrane protein